jgi:hypothetical protein
MLTGLKISRFAFSNDESSLYVATRAGTFHQVFSNGNFKWPREITRYKIKSVFSNIEVSDSHVYSLTAPGEVIPGPVLVEPSKKNC